MSSDTKQSDSMFSFMDNSKSDSSKSDSSKSDSSNTQSKNSNNIFSFMENSNDGGSKVSDMFKDTTPPSKDSVMKESDKSSAQSSMTAFDAEKDRPVIKAEKMDMDSLRGKKKSWFPDTKSWFPDTKSWFSDGSSSRLWIKILLVVILLGFLGFNILYYLGYSFKKVWGLVKRFFKSIIQLFKGGVHHDKGLQDQKNQEDQEDQKKSKDDKKKTPKTMNDMENQIDDPDLRPKKDDPPETVEPEVDTTKIHTSGKSGYCNVGSWKGIRSCVKVNNKNECMSGDIFPTKEICINPNLRT